jgi:hypothetical protein
MAKRFLTRVELYGSYHTSAEYEKLHAEMAKRNFDRTITADDGTVFELPPAEYHSWSENLTAEQVRGLAAEAARAVGYVPWPGTPSSKDCAVITCDANRIAWDGLKRQQKKAA